MNPVSCKGWGWHDFECLASSSHSLLKNQDPWDASKWAISKHIKTSLLWAKTAIWRRRRGFFLLRWVDSSHFLVQSSHENLATLILRNPRSTNVEIWSGGITYQSYLVYQTLSTRTDLPFPSLPPKISPRSCGFVNWAQVNPQEQMVRLKKKQQQEQLRRSLQTLFPSSESNLPQKFQREYCCTSGLPPNLSY